MKKIIMASLLLSLCVSVSLGQGFIGSRQAGMGGAGVASAVGLNAVAYNPAGILDGPTGELLLSAGGSTTGLDQISAAISGYADPSKFIKNNYSNKLDANGTVSGILGFNLGHQALSVVVPSATVVLNKLANSVASTFEAVASGAVAYTFGYSFSTPGLPFAAINFGANAKAVSTTYGNMKISGDPSVTSPIVTATQETAQGSGFGFDVGTKINFQVPLLTDFSVGVVMQNISQSVAYKPTTRTDTYTYSATGEPTVTTGTATTGAQITAKAPAVTIIGCSGTIPGLGIKLAADIASTSGGSGILAAASESVTHLGIEYPLFLGALIVRAGMATSPTVSYTTLGTKINLPLLTLEIANVINNKNSKNTSYTVDAGFAF